MTWGPRHTPVPDGDRFVGSSLSAVHFEAASPIGLGLPPLELARDLEGFKGAPFYSNGRLASTQIGVITSPQSQFHLEIPGIPSYPQAPLWNSRTCYGHVPFSITVLVR